jgi:Domain of unknown function (DUF4169)
MAEIVNLRRARKAAKRMEEDKSAASARVKHGTPKALRDEINARREKAARDIEAHRIEPKE